MNCTSTDPHLFTGIILRTLAQRITLPRIALDPQPSKQVNQALSDLTSRRVVRRVVRQP